MRSQRILLWLGPVTTIPLTTGIAGGQERPQRSVMGHASDDMDVG